MATYCESYAIFGIFGQNEKFSWSWHGARDHAKALGGRNEKAHCNLRSKHLDLRLQWALTRRSSMSRSHVTVRTVRGFDAFFLA